MTPMIPSPAGQGIPVHVPSCPVKPTRLERLFSVLMTVAAVSSVLSTLAFVGYLLLPQVTSQPRAHYVFLYGVGIAGLVIAEICQVLGVATLIGQWASHTNPQKKPKELAILLLSLIPYMAVVIFLIILVVYLRTRWQDSTSEKTREAAHELKKQAVDTIIDVGAAVSSSEAQSPAASVSNRGATHHSTRSSLQQAVSRVVGPSTGKTASDVAQGIVVFTVVAFLVATVATAGVVLPGKGLASLRPLWVTRAVSSEHPKHTHTPAPSANSDDLTHVDWANFTYTSSCYSATPQQFVVRNGKATVGFIYFQIYTPVYGDLTGDGLPEAAIPYSCTGADFGGVQVFIYTGTATHPVELGELPLGTESAQGSFASVNTIQIQNEQITLTGDGYSSQAGHCCPDLHFQVTYQWKSSAFVVTNAQVTPLPTPTPFT